MTFPQNSSLQIYRFILETIRTEDSKNGEFLKRYLSGPQTVWGDIEQRIFEYLELWDILNVEDEYLKYLKQQVGWTPDLDYITDRVDDLALRKLIANAVSIWKQRGTEDIISDIITFSTGAAAKLFNWFYYKNILDERALGCDYHLSDVYENDEGGYSEYTMVLKVVDDGFLDRELVTGLCSLMKPSNEIINIIYHHFLDYFENDGDDSQWLTIENEIVTIADESMLLSGATKTGVLVEVLGSYEWENYSLKSKINMPTPNINIGSFGIYFQYADSDNHRHMFISRTETSHKLTMYRVVGGVETIEAIVDLDELGITVDFDVFNCFNLELIEEATTQKIRFYIEENEVINGSYTQLPDGTMGFYHDSNSEIYVKDVEVMYLPVETDIVQ